MHHTRYAPYRESVGRHHISRYIYIYVCYYLFIFTLECTLLGLRIRLHSRLQIVPQGHLASCTGYTNAMHYNSLALSPFLCTALVA